MGFRGGLKRIQQLYLLALVIAFESVQAYLLTHQSPLVGSERTLVDLDLFQDLVYDGLRLSNLALPTPKLLCSDLIPG